MSQPAVEGTLAALRYSSWEQVQPVGDGEEYRNLEIGLRQVQPRVVCQGQQGELNSAKRERLREALKRQWHMKNGQQGRVPLTHERFLPTPAPAFDVEQHAVLNTDQKSLLDCVGSDKEGEAGTLDQVQLGSGVGLSTPEATHAASGPRVRCRAARRSPRPVRSAALPPPSLSLQ